MNIAARIIVFTTLSLAAANCVAQVDGCTALGKTEAETALPHLKRAFRDAGLYPIERIDIAPGRDCGNAFYFLFQVKLVYRPLGLSWILSQDKATGKVTIQQNL